MRVPTSTRWLIATFVLIVPVLILGTIRLCAVFNAPEGRWLVRVMCSFNANHLIAVATVAYAFLALLQWSAIRVQADIARRASENLLSRDSPKVVVIFEAPGGQYNVPPNEIWVEAHNFGRTAMFINDVCVEFTVGRELPPQPVYMRCRPPQTPYIVQPNDSYREQYDVGGDWPSEARQTSGNEGGVQCWVYGYIQYDDVFDRKRRKGFCGRWKANSTIDQVHGLPSGYTYLRQLDKRRMRWKDVE